jgi:hypothetical protein
VGGVDQPVEDRVGEGRVVQLAVPLIDGELAGEDGQAGADAIVEDLRDQPKRVITFNRND